MLTSAKLFLYQNVHNIMGYHHGKFHDSSICQFGYLRGGGAESGWPFALWCMLFSFNKRLVSVWVWKIGNIQTSLFFFIFLFYPPTTWITCEETIQRWPCCFKILETPVILILSFREASSLTLDFDWWRYFYICKNISRTLEMIVSHVYEIYEKTGDPD